MVATIIRKRVGGGYLLLGIHRRTAGVFACHGLKGRRHERLVGRLCLGRASGGQFIIVSIVIISSSSSVIISIIIVIIISSSVIIIIIISRRS